MPRIGRKPHEQIVCDSRRDFTRAAEQIVDDFASTGSRINHFIDIREAAVPFVMVYAHSAPRRPEI